MGPLPGISEPENLERGNLGNLERWALDLPRVEPQHFKLRNFGIFSP